MYNWNIAQARYPGNGRRAFYENQFESGRGNQRRLLRQHRNEQFQRELIRRMGRPAHRWDHMGIGMGGMGGIGMGMGVFGGPHMHFPHFRHHHGHHHRFPMVGGHGRRPLFPRRHPGAFSGGLPNLDLRMLPRRSSLYHSAPTSRSPYIPPSYRSPFSARGGYPYTGGLGHHHHHHHHHRRGGYFRPPGDDDDDDAFDDDEDWGECGVDDDWDLDSRDDRGYYSDSYTSRPPFSGPRTYTGDFDDYEDEGPFTRPSSRYYGSTTLGSGYGYGGARPYSSSYGYSSRSTYPGYSRYSGYGSA